LAAARSRGCGRSALSRARQGQLLAVDGAHGADVAEAAVTLTKLLARRDTACGISRWDASGLFADVAAAPVAQRDVSPRSLVLLYAADLAFRLRWEIQPALEQGLAVVAAPYVATATTFGLATGLSAEWLASLFRFAPPARTAVLAERKPSRVWKRKPDRGFGECCTTLLEATPEGFARKKARRAMLAALARLADDHGGLVGRRGLREIVAELD
jgi:thymidylate kinase